MNQAKTVESSQPRAVAAMGAAVAGATIAVLLGMSGFGIGCLYAQAVPASPLPQVALAAASAAPGIGGPEEETPEETQESPVAMAGDAATPSVAVALPPARAARAVVAMYRPVLGGWVSSHFGRRIDPFTGQPAVHRGMDFAGIDNSVIIAAGAGVVTWSGGRRSYGNLIEIDHGNGYLTRYGHNSSNLVAVGDYVKPGQAIALMGATGRATGTHLHFEVLYRGRQVDPARYVPRSI